MPTLYVENVPAELYSALRKLARDQRRSLAAQVISILEQHVPTESELKRRRDFFKKLQDFRLSVERPEGSFPTSEEIIREDRDR